MNKAIFLDCDGTIIVDKGYLNDPKLIEFLPGVIDALKKFRNMGFILVVVSNQSGIGRGYFTEEHYLKIQKYFIKMLNDYGVELHGCYYCPHTPEENCNCRKPKIGMALNAKNDLNIDFSKSYMIGDKESDIQFGKNLGMADTSQHMIELLKCLEEDIY
jgi:D-glycero-D-manno-heptose 1,7-bisphosphate phosphatase